MDMFVSRKKFNYFKNSKETKINSISKSIQKSIKFNFNWLIALTFNCFHHFTSKSSEYSKMCYLRQSICRVRTHSIYQQKHHSNESKKTSIQLFNWFQVLKKLSFKFQFFSKNVWKEYWIQISMKVIDYWKMRHFLFSTFQEINNV